MISAKTYSIQNTSLYLIKKIEHKCVFQFSQLLFFLLTSFFHSCRLRQREKQPVPGSCPRKEGAAAEAETLSNLLGADGRGRFSGTMFSSELARHGGHSLRSLHRGATTTAALRGVVDAATSPPPAAPITTHAAAVAATHARRNPSALQRTITATDLERRLAIAAGLAGHDATQPTLSER